MNDNPVLVAYLLIGASCLVTAGAIFFGVRYGGYSSGYRAGRQAIVEDAKETLLQIERRTAECQRHLHACEAATYHVLDEVYQARQSISTIRPPRFSPPGGNSPPTQRSA